MFNSGGHSASWFNHKSYAYTISLSSEEQRLMGWVQALASCTVRSSNNVRSQLTPEPVVWKLEDCLIAIAPDSN